MSTSTTTEWWAPTRGSSLSEWKKFSNPSRAEGPRSTSRNSTPEAWRSLELDGQRQHTQMSNRLFWTCRRALFALARRRRVSGRQVEVVISHTTICGLVRSETLSLFCTSYVFFCQVMAAFATLWPTVTAEFQAVAGLMVFLVRNLSRRVHARICVICRQCRGTRSVSLTRSGLGPRGGTWIELPASPDTRRRVRRNSDGVRAGHEPVFPTGPATNG